MNISEIEIYNPGILCSNMPETTFKELLDSCNTQIKNKSVAKALKRNSVIDSQVEGIEESIGVNVPESYNQFMHDLSLAYAERYRMPISKHLRPKMGPKWLNLQKQYEYRPLHQHGDASGVGLSFVTYIKIPYDLIREDQFTNHGEKATIHRNGRIEFIYNSLTGKQITTRLDIDESYEGKTIIFLNTLLHVVYPFYTSSDYRISLAGNIYFV